MKETFDLKFTVVKAKNEFKSVTVELNSCPMCMSTKDICDFIVGLTEISGLCINEANERIKNG